MAEIRTVTTLEAKRTDIRNTIADLERRLAQARADLASVTACIRLFDLEDVSRSRIPAYADVHRLFKHRELGRLCQEAMVKAGKPLDTRELAAYAMEVKGLDGGDKLLAKGIAFRIIHAMRMQERRGKVVGAGKRNSVRLWTLPQRRDSLVP